MVGSKTFLRENDPIWDNKVYNTHTHTQTYTPKHIHEHAKAHAHTNTHTVQIIMKLYANVTISLNETLTF